MQGKKAEMTASHKWTCFLRSPKNEDLSYFIKKVVFTLHPSFTNPKREVTQYPFEIHEVGWGEFEIGIQIYFVNEYEKPIEITHLLKLHPSQLSIQQSTKKPIVSEFYDEIVFMNPSNDFINILNTEPQIFPIDHVPVFQQSVVEVDGQQDNLDDLVSQVYQKFL